MLEDKRLETQRHIKDSHDVDIIREFSDRKPSVDELAKFRQEESCPVLSSAFLSKRSTNKGNYMCMEGLVVWMYITAQDCRLVVYCPPPIPIRQITRGIKKFEESKGH